MLVFPDCKINLGLRILNKRADGYHNIETIFYPLPFNDALEIILSHKTDPLIFSHSGLPVNGDSTDNLCVKAYWLLKKDFPELPCIQMHLHKCIPMGAGLGGGSADAAFTLQLLNKLFSLNLSVSQLIAYATHLGSDCAFFIINTPCMATGRGELLEPVTANLSGYILALVNPGIHVSTGEAFSAVPLHQASSKQLSLIDIINQPVNTWQKFLVNDFEESVFKTYPLIKDIKEHLYKIGAVYAAMSGSGSSVFALFSKKNPPSININLPFFVKLISL
jgi:4-diphosphocytidyl-2-C-methyl-D-erythritol kinase